MFNSIARSLLRCNSVNRATGTYLYVEHFPSPSSLFVIAERGSRHWDLKFRRLRTKKLLKSEIPDFDEVRQLPSYIPERGLAKIEIPDNNEPRRDEKITREQLVSCLKEGRRLKLEIPDFDKLMREEKMSALQLPPYILERARVTIEIPDINPPRPGEEFDVIKMLRPSSRETSRLIIEVPDFDELMREKNITVEQLPSYILDRGLVKIETPLPKHVKS